MNILDGDPIDDNEIRAEGAAHGPGPIPRRVNGTGNALPHSLDGLRARRQEVGLSQERLAQIAACSTSTVRLAERGVRPSAEMAARLARALGCEVDRLVEGPRETT